MRPPLLPKSSASARPPVSPTTSVVVPILEESAVAVGVPVEVSACTGASFGPQDFEKFIYPTMFVLHSFSGRRRAHDLQLCFDNFACLTSASIVVLSLDVVLGPRGDLLDGANRQFWRNRIRAGQVIGMVAGPPCETWSLARFLPDGPVPLRSVASPWI